MYVISVKAKTLGEMREKLVNLAEIYANANLEAKRERRAKNAEEKTGVKEFDSAVAASQPQPISQSDYAPRADELLPSKPIDLMTETKSTEVTKDDLIGAMQKIVEKKGISAVTEILKKYNVNRISSLIPADYAKVAKDFAAVI